MTIAHNTISVDGQRQAQATGKLLDWHVGDSWTAVRADAGLAYANASLQRTILLTPGYVLIVDRCESKDGQPHTFNWAYHNVGTATTAGTVDMKPYTFTAANGYQHLSHAMHGDTVADLTLHFVAERKPSNANSDSNSPPATYDSAPRRLSTETAHAQLALQMVGAPATEVFTGNAPSRESPTPVPFVIARRKGTSVTFATLLSTSTTGNQAPHLRQTGDGTFQIESTEGVDSFSVDGFRFEHTVK